MRNHNHASGDTESVLDFEYDNDEAELLSDAGSNSSSSSGRYSADVEDSLCPLSTNLNCSDSTSTMNGHLKFVNPRQHFIRRIGRDEDCPIRKHFLKPIVWGKHLDPNVPIFLDSSSDSTNESEELNHMGEEEVKNCEDLSTEIIVSEDNCNNNMRDADIMRPDYNRTFSNEFTGENQVQKPQTKPVNLIINYNSLTKERNLKTKKKKKAWDLKFAGNPIRLCSNDDIIKYMPLENENVSENEVLKTHPEPLVVKINNNEKIVTSQSNTENILPGNSFKIPLKRPPTRLKVVAKTSPSTNAAGDSSLTTTRTVISGSNKDPPTTRTVNISQQIEPTTHEDCDDSISLCASTSFFGEESPLPIVDTGRQSSSSGDFRNPVQESESKVRQWVTLDTPKRQADFSSVPEVFKGICYWYFLKKNCYRGDTCRNFHIINPAVYLSKFSAADTAQLIAAYKYTLTYDLLYKNVYQLFAEVFAERNLERQLLNIAEDVFHVNGVNPVEGVQVVVDSLVKAGYTFADALVYISVNIGLMKIPSLGNVLVEVITRKPDIIQYWPTIRQLTLGGDKLRPDLARKILQRLVFSFEPNKKVCLEAYDFIVKKQILSCSQIPENVLNAYKHLEQADISQLEIHINQNLIKERTCFESTVVQRTSPVFPLSNSAIQQTSPTFQQTSPVVDSPSFSPSEQNRQDIDERLPQISDSSPSNRWRGVQNRRSMNSFSSDSDPSDGTQWRKMPVPQTYYNKSGLEYDPVADYVPPNKRSRISDDFQSELNISFAKDQETQVKMPEFPIYGKLVFNDNYLVDQSVHNLYVQRTESEVPIDKEDILNLKDAITTCSAKDFLKMVEKYKGPPTIQSFIAMVITHFKELKKLMCRHFLNLLSHIEVANKNFYGNTYVRVVLEVVTMNILFELEKLCLWQDARVLLEKFSNWDSIITSKLYMQRRVSIMGRYIFLTKIFVHANRYNLAFEILQSPTLQLLASPTKWPYQCIVPSVGETDLMSRNNVLYKFVSEGYYCDMMVICEMYKLAFGQGRIEEYDIEQYFNPMVTRLIDRNATQLLRHIHNNIDIFYKNMDKNNLRAYLCIMYNSLPREDQFKLYDMCAERGIYPRLGLDAVWPCKIPIRLNLLNEELDLQVRYFFFKVRELRFVPKYNIQFIIGAPSTRCYVPKILNVARSLNDVFNTMLNSLQHYVRVEQGPNPWVIQINRSSLIEYCMSFSKSSSTFSNSTW